MNSLAVWAVVYLILAIISSLTGVKDIFVVAYVLMGIICVVGNRIIVEIDKINEQIAAIRRQ